jgi:hypothetical protein
VPGVTKVSFTHNGRTVMAVVVAVNDKTITVVEENGHRWRVAPSYLKIVEGGNGSHTG